MGNYSSKDGEGERIGRERVQINPGQRDDEESIPSRTGGNVRGSAAGPMGPIGNQHEAQQQQMRSIAMFPDDGSIGAQSSVSLSSGQLESTIPTVFKWEHGGRHVYITGTFNNWERQIPMHRSGNDFTYVHNLKRGKHAFKFIVDDEWRFAPDQPTIADIEGRINNFIDVSEFTPYTGDDNFFEKSKERKIPEQDFRQQIPDLDDYTKESVNICFPLLKRRRIISYFWSLGLLRCRLTSATSS